MKFRAFYIVLLATILFSYSHGVSYAQSKDLIKECAHWEKTFNKMHKACLKRYDELKSYIKDQKVLALRLLMLYRKVEYRYSPKGQGVEFTKLVPHDKREIEDMGEIEYQDRIRRKKDFLKDFATSFQKTHKRITGKNWHLEGKGWFLREKIDDALKTAEFSDNYGRIKLTFAKNASSKIKTTLTIQGNAKYDDGQLRICTHYPGTFKYERWDNSGKYGSPVFSKNGSFHNDDVPKSLCTSIDRKTARINITNITGLPYKNHWKFYNSFIAHYKGNPECIALFKGKTYANYSLITPSLKNKDKSVLDSSREFNLYNTKDSNTSENKGAESQTAVKEE